MSEILQQWDTNLSLGLVRRIPNAPEPFVYPAEKEEINRRTIGLRKQQEAERRAKLDAQLWQG